MSSADDRIDELFTLFATYGTARYDESVSLTDHCLQTAEHAIASEADDHLVAAALLHDVGHFLLAAHRGTENYLAVDWDHDAIGERWVTEVFGPKIGRIVGLHVDAKRYLCATHRDYFVKLSTASIASLEVQGGPMNRQEIGEFEAVDGWQDAILVRQWDDRGKSSHVITAQLISYGELLKPLVHFNT